jgi:hypothetical protein
LPRLQQLEGFHNLFF